MCLTCLTGQVKSGGGGWKHTQINFTVKITALRAISVIYVKESSALFSIFYFIRRLENRSIYLHNILFQVETREKMLQQLQTNFDSLQQHRNGLEQEINRRQQQVNQLQEQLLVAEESSRNLSSEVSHGADRLIMTHVWA